MVKQCNLIAAIVIIILILVPLAAVFFEDYQNVSPYTEDSNATFSGNIEREGETRFHSVRVLENVTRIHCILKCPGVDFDLYGRIGELPSRNEYDFIGYSTGGENIYYDYPESGILHLMVYSYSGIGHYNLIVEFEYSE